jgi:hypothetical protein
MDQQPSPAARPSVVTMVAIALFVRGGPSILGGLVALTGGSFLAGVRRDGDARRMGHHRDPGGRGRDLAGTGILNLREQARMVAPAVVGIDAVLTVIFLVQGAGGASSASRWMRSSSGRS